MEKRKMLSFDVIGQLTVKALASVFLFFCAGMIIKGVLEHGETATGEAIMIAFALLFVVGGIVGICRVIRKYRDYRRDNPQERNY